MKLPRLRTILLTPLALFALVYIAGAATLALKDDSIAVFEEPTATYETIAIFGASGTAGDGILKAALANPDISKIQVITRRATPRIEEGVASGKVEMTLHMDYLDYSAVQQQMADADAVYWAIGISSVGVDEKTYGTIHVDFPARFLAAWILSRVRSAIVSRSNCAKHVKRFSVSRPTEVEVSNCCVTAANATPFSSKRSISRTKSAMERESRSIL